MPTSQPTMTWQATLSPVDYLVAVIILLVPVGIGIYYAFKDVHHVTRVEYLLGGRRMSSLPVAMSLFVSFQSAISFIGMPAEVYYHGFIFVLAAFGMVLAYVFGIFLVAPLMHPLKITSVNEYLILRFKSEAVRLLCSTIAMISLLVYMAITLLSPALALETSANVPLWLSIVVLGAAGTLYTAIGGFKSVIWTDVFQFGIIAIGLTIIIVKTIVDVGGVGEMLRISYAGGRLRMDNFHLDPRTRHTVWGLVFGIAVIWGTNQFQQATLQRTSSMRTLQEAKRAYALAAVFLFVITIALGCMGLLIFVYFSVRGCDPLEAGYINNQNQIAAYFVLHTMADLPGMAGLFISVLCCGSLSTLSSGINALATLTVEDVLRRPFRSLNEKTITNITKMVAVAFGALVIGLTFIMKSFEGNIIQLAITVVTSFVSPTCGIFVMGASVPWANKLGALSGATVAFIFNLWVNIGSQLFGKRTPFLPLVGTENCLNGSELTNTSANIATVLSIDNSTSGSFHATDDFSIYDISYLWFTLMGTAVCIFVGLTVSRITNVLPFLNADYTKTGSGTTDARLIFPCLRKIWGLQQPRSRNGQYSVVNSQKGYDVECLGKGIM